MGQCLAKFRKGGNQSVSRDPFPDHYTESHICDYFVDRLPARLLGEGIHLLRGGPGPIVMGWTHELLNDAGVHSYQDRELLLKTRDDIVAAVEVHRHRLRQLHPSRTASSADFKSRTAGSAAELSGSPLSAATSPADSPNVPQRPKSPAGTGPAPVSDTAEIDAGATAFDKAAAKLAIHAAEAAAAAAAAEATAKSTAFSSEGDGKNLRLTTDWLPAGLRLYRISEEIRHMASSGNLDPSIHSKSAGVLDVSVKAAATAAAAVAAAAAAAATGGGVPLQARSKSRFYSNAGSGSAGRSGAGADAERDDDGAAQERDVDVISVAAAVMSEPSPRRGGGAGGREDEVPGGTAPEQPPPQRLLPGISGAAKCCAAATGAAVGAAGGEGVAEAGGGCSCVSGSGGGRGGGSPDSCSPGSTLGAESLATLTGLEVAAPPLPPSHSLPALLSDVDITCAVSGGAAAPLALPGAGGARADVSLGKGQQLEGAIQQPPQRHV